MILVGEDRKEKQKLSIAAMTKMKNAQSKCQ